MCFNLYVLQFFVVFLIFKKGFGLILIHRSGFFFESPVDLKTNTYENEVKAELNEKNIYTYRKITLLALVVVMVEYKYITHKQAHSIRFRNAVYKTDGLF